LISIPESIVDDYDRRLQAKFPWACGSCMFTGAPGYCARTSSHGNMPVTNCGHYFMKSCFKKAFEWLAGQGIFTGDAFTTRNELDLSPPYIDIYIGVWQRSGEVEYIDFFPDTRVWLDTKASALSSEHKDGKLSIAFGNITKIWLLKGTGFCQSIYEADIGIKKKEPKRARATKLDEFSS
jgi:hypothetical protein